MKSTPDTHLDAERLGTVSTIAGARILLTREFLLEDQK
jgi:hypothetical protein